MRTNDDAVIFIVGSPRSGTTILGEVLNLHPQIAQWYEPYFIWDRHFRQAPDDNRTAEDATHKVKHYIRKNFCRYQHKSKCDFVVDKSPRNSLKIPFIQKIFPRARFIHILRDGRDATLSINRKWVKHLEIVENSSGRMELDYKVAVSVIKTWLKHQPFLTDRVKALWFETRGHIFNKDLHTNRLRWKGQTGWGPRFQDWEKYFRDYTLLQFNAYQWEQCVNKVLMDLEDIDHQRKMTFLYEDFVQNPTEILDKIISFIGAEKSLHMYENLPEMKKDNFYKWKKQFSEEDINDIQPILTPTLDKVGYLEKWPW